MECVVWLAGERLHHIKGVLPETASSPTEVAAPEAFLKDGGGDGGDWRGCGAGPGPWDYSLPGSRGRGVDRARVDSRSRLRFCLSVPPDWNNDGCHLAA